MKVKPCSFSGRNTTSRSSSPRTKTGIEMPTRTPTVETRSKTLRARVADRMPTPSPMISHRMTPPNTMEAVGGRSCLMIVLTDSPL